MNAIILENTDITHSMYTHHAALVLLLTLGTVKTCREAGSLVNKRWTIIGGQYTHIGRYPYTVSVYLKDVLLGGGAIVNRNWIVCSASQFDDYDLSTRFTIRAGSDHWNTGGQAVKSLLVILHPNYEEMMIDYNVALIKTSAFLRFGRNVRPVKLGNRYPTEGCKSVVTGWGFTSFSEFYAKRLKVGKVTVKSAEECNNTYGSTNFTKLNICADADKVGPCMGDMGDPLVCKGKLIGLFNGGDLCNTFQTYDVYTNVEYHRQWILEKIQNNTNPQEFTAIRDDDDGAVNDNIDDDDEFDFSQT